MIAPKYDELATSNKYPNVVYLKVDVDEARDVARRYKIRSMPTFLFIADREIDRFSGANIVQLRETVARSLKSLNQKTDSQSTKK
jgi:thioredoxin-like negative regulator of GroEL